MENSHQKNVRVKSGNVDKVCVCKLNSGVSRPALRATGIRQKLRDQKAYDSCHVSVNLGGSIGKEIHHEDVRPAMAGAHAARPDIG